MKNFFTVLILIFVLQSFSKADDIREFELEGVSIGDSLLNITDELAIKSSISKKQYPNDKFIIYEADKFLKIKKYDYMGVTTLKNDRDYSVTSISGMINYDKLKKCLDLKKEIQKSIEKIIKYDQKEEVEYDIDDGKIYGVQFYFNPYPSVEAIVINCYHYTTVSGRQRNLSVSVNSENFAKFLINEAYK